MTTHYLATERARADRKPTYLYFFNDRMPGTGSGVSSIGPWLYHSGDHELISTAEAVPNLQFNDPSNFAPLEGIWHEEIDAGTELARRAVRIHMPGDAPLATVLRVDGMLQRRIWVRILRAHVGGVGAFGVMPTVYRGQISAVEFSGTECIVTANSTGTALRRSVPLKVFQSLCNNFLYDQHCGVNSTFFLAHATIASVVGRIVTLTWDGDPGGFFGPFNFAPHDDGEFTGGVLIGKRGNSSSGHAPAREFIELHQDDGVATGTLTLLQPAAWATVGLDVQVLPGCDRSRATCESKFNNLDRFMGFHQAPKTNPVRAHFTGFGEAP